MLIFDVFAKFKVVYECLMITIILDITQSVCQSVILYYILYFYVSSD